MRFRINAYLICIVLLCIHTFAWAEDIQNIRIGIKKSYTRIVFDLDKAPKIYNVKYMTSPDRIILDFTEGRIKSGAIKNTSAYPLINKINGINIQDSGFNIEIELQQAANFKHFVLPPSKKAGYRLVLDITPGVHIVEKIRRVAPSSPQTIIPKLSKSSRPGASISKNNVTDYKSDKINLYDNKILSDAKIEQLFQSIQGNTQLRESYYIDTVKQKKERRVKATDSKKTVDSAPHFDVRGYQIKGNTLLSLDKLKTIIKPFAGKQKNFSDVQHAMESLEQAYQKRGYGMV